MDKTALWWQIRSYATKKIAERETEIAILNQRERESRKIEGSRKRRASERRGKRKGGRKRGSSSGEGTNSWPRAKAKLRPSTDHSPPSPNRTLSSRFWPLRANFKWGKDEVGKGDAGKKMHYAGFAENTQIDPNRARVIDDWEIRIYGKYRDNEFAGNIA